MFNFEGGCYAKAIRLSATGEPEILRRDGRFGTGLKNVVVDPVTLAVDFDSDKSPRHPGQHPIHFIPNHHPAA